MTRQGKIIPADDLWPTMPRETFETILDWARYLADELGLRDWVITIKQTPIDADDDDEKDAWAKVHTTYGRKSATIWLCLDFGILPADTQRHTMVHELIHPHLEPILHLLGGTVDRLVGANAGWVLVKGVEQHNELAVDAMADVLAPYLPTLDEFRAGHWAREMKVPS